MLLHDAGKKTSDMFWSWAVHPMIPGAMWMLLVAGVAGTYDPSTLSAVFAALVVLSPLWLPVVLFVAFWYTWIHYIRYRYWFSLRHILVHVELPPEVQKSPAAMEAFLVALWNSGGETTFIQRIWKGQFRHICSLEIAGNEGRIGFYIHMREQWKDIVEARLYGQFPEARMTVVEDYVREVNYNENEYQLFAVEYQKGDTQALPIKTYIDYGMDKNPDTPEIQVDPITNILELMGTLGKGQHLWMQIVMKARKRDEWYGFYYSNGGTFFPNGIIFGKRDDYKDEGNKRIKEITEGAVRRAQELIKDDAAKERAAERSTTLMTEVERRKVEAIQRNYNKFVFECGFRVIHVAKKENFNGLINGAVIRFFDSYRAPDYNSLGATRGTQIFDYPWQDFRDIRLRRVKKDSFFWYKYRAFFYVPVDQAPQFMTTEELATIWHFPNSAVKTPALQRVPSRRAEAPANLPIGKLPI